MVTKRTKEEKLKLTVDDEVCVLSKTEWFNANDIPTLTFSGRLCSTKPAVKKLNLKQGW